MAFSDKVGLAVCAIGACAAGYRQWRADRVEQEVVEEEGYNDPELISIEYIVSQIPDDYEFNYPWILVTRKEIPPIGDSTEKPWSFSILEPSEGELVARSQEGFTSRAEALHVGEKVAAYFDRAQAEKNLTEVTTPIQPGAPKVVQAQQPLELGGYI